MEFIQPKNSYFAAANGFSGFRSYFNEIFRPEDYIGIYVLKGGPGTGKSSLMKKICTHFQNQEFECEAIFCSSDKNSLDGIIIKSKNGKIAIIDGTAPHETDAKIPGAIDEIVNLGEAWDEKILRNKREDILKLNVEKKSYYKSAYEYLNLAGVFFHKIYQHISDAYTLSDLSVINDVLFDIPVLNKGRTVRNHLVSSFGKDGYSTLAVKELSARSKASVSGAFGSEYIFMNHLLNAAEAKKTSYIRYTSPYSSELVEGIFFTETATLISVGNDFNEKIDTTQFIDNCYIEKNLEKLKYYACRRDELLKLSQNEFAKAAKSHFELEKIYTSAMHFDRLNSLCANLILEMEKRLI